MPLAREVRRFRVSYPKGGSGQKNVFFSLFNKKHMHLDQLHACEKYKRSVRYTDAVNQKQRDGVRWGRWRWE